MPPSLRLRIPVQHQGYPALCAVSLISTDYTTRTDKEGTGCCFYSYNKLQNIGLVGATHVVAREDRAGLRGRSHGSPLQNMF